MEYETRYIQTNGIRLHLIETGPKLGSPVIFLHGFPEFWYGWRKQIPAFAQAGYRVIVPDQRGYNLSDKPRGIRAYRMLELVKDVLGLIAGLNYEKVNLVGHDWGGAVAWMLAILHPEHIHRMGILNCPHPSIFRRYLLRDLEQVHRSRYMFYFQLPWLAEAGMRADQWRGLARAMRGSARTHTFTTEDMKQYNQAWSQPGALKSMINWYRAAFRYPYRNSGGSRVKIPTLMLWGMKDFALTHRMARPSMDFCDDSRLIFLPEATHWVQHEEAEEVNYSLIEFFKA